MEREMDAYGVGRASFLEMFWTVVCALGAGVCARLLWAAIQDLRFLRANHINGDRSLVAIDVIVGKAVYVGVLTAFVIIGVVAMLTPSPHANGKPTLAAFVTTLVFVLTALTFTVHSVLRWRWREEYIRRRLARHAREAEAWDGTERRRT